MKLIFGYGLHKIHWEAHGTRDALLMAEQKHVEEAINQLVDKGYKILRIDFVYIRED